MGSDDRHGRRERSRLRPLDLLRRLAPFPLRTALVRLRHQKAWEKEAPLYRLDRRSPDEFPCLAAERRSPLRRPGATYAEKLQLGKESNVALASGFIDGLVIPPGGVFSYHHAVGPPVRKRGFVMGAELHDGVLQPGIGGGCCQVSNLLYVLALLSGAEIVERHRHGYDLFPDSERTIPFGCGATVYFPLKDLRFRNGLDQDLLVSLRIEEEFLVGRTWTAHPVNTTWEIFEAESSMHREDDAWVRENKVARCTICEGGEASVEIVAHNIARCLYDPSEGG